MIKRLTPYFPIALSLITTGSILVLNIGSGVIAARVLGPEDRGLFAIILAWPMLFAGLSSFALTPTLASQLAKGGDPEVTRTNAMQFSCITSIIGVLALWLAVGVLVDIPANAVLPIIGYMFLLIPLNHISQMYVGILQGGGQHKYWNLVRITPHAVYMMACVPIWLLGLNSVHWFGASHLVSNFAVVAFALYLSRKPFAVVLTHLRTLKSMFFFGLRLHAVRSLSVLRVHSDRILLSVLVSAYDLGLFVVAFTFASIITAFSTTFADFLVPEVARYVKADRNVKASQGAYLVSLFGLGGVVLLCAGLGVLIFGHFLISFLFGVEYVAAYEVSVLLAIFAGVIGLTKMLEPIFISINRPALLSLSEFAYLIVFGLLLFAWNHDISLERFVVYQILGGGSMLAITAISLIWIGIGSRRKFR